MHRHAGKTRLQPKEKIQAHFFEAGIRGVFR
jgi:hypothetical protein